MSPKDEIWFLRVCHHISNAVDMCSNTNGFRDRAISLHSCKIVDKEILRIVSDVGIYCSSDKIGTADLVQYVFENPRSTSMYFSARVKTWCVARLSAS